MHYKINIKQYKFLWCLGYPYVIYPSLLIIPMHLFYSPLPKCSLFSIYHIFCPIIPLSRAPNPTPWSLSIFLLFWMLLLVTYKHPKI